MFILQFKLNQQYDQIQHFKMYQANKIMKNLEFYYSEKAKATEESAKKLKTKSMSK